MSSSQLIKSTSALWFVAYPLGRESPLSSTIDCYLVAVWRLEVPRIINRKLRVIQNPASELKESSTPGPTSPINGKSLTQKW